MDSGNSGSLQSSSGGDDEFDSRCGADSSPLSALLRHPPPSAPGFSGGGSLIYGLQELRTPPPLSHWRSTTPPPLPAGADASASPPSLPGHHGAATTAAGLADAAPPAQAAPQRGSSRKRARASRRAPTTVLTTDTSNFRAMVQEFTGIPAPPFAAAGAATARSRFDHLLFPLRTAAAGAASPAAALPQYLLRPFAHKVQVHASAATPYQPSFTSPSTSSPAPANVSIAPASTTTTPGTTTAVASSTDSYHNQLTAASTTSALLGMQQDHGNNSYHSFHQSSSLGVGDAKYAAHPAFDRGIAPPPSPSATRLQDPADFLGRLSHDDVMVGSQGPPHAQLHPRNGGDELSGLVGGASSVTGAGGCKATYSATRPLLERNNRRNPSAAGGSTATTAAATAGMRTQAGVVESWVCTSD